MNVSPIPTTRIDKDHPKDQIIGDFNSAIQTRRMTKISDEHAMKVIQALEDPSWIEAMQEKVLQFQLQKMDVKSAFLYGTIDEEVYVDDIIFGSTKKSLCDEFEGLMHKRFQMSSMGELIFFLGLQVQQKKDGIFISQDKYVADILKKFDFATVKTRSTLMEPNKALIKDEEAGITPKMSHLHAVKRIFRYMKGQPKLGLWYLRDSPFDLEAFFDSDYAGVSLNRKSTTGGCQFLGKRLISWQCKKQTIVANSTTKAEYVVVANCCGQSSGPINLVADETVNKEWEDRVERVATTASSLDAEQDSDSGPKCQDTILGGADAQTRFETASKQSNDSPLSRGYTLGSGEDSMKLLELMELCTKLLDLEIIDFLNANQIHYALTVNPTIYTSCIKQFSAIEKAKTVNGEHQLQALVDKKKIPITIQPSTSKLQKKQSRRKQKKTTAVPHPSDSTGDVPNKEYVPTHSNDPLLSGEDRLKLTDLMDMCTKLFERVLDLEHTKTDQAQEIIKLKLRVIKLEKKAGLRAHKFKRLYKVGVTRRVEYSDDESLGAQKDAFNQRRSIGDIDKDAEVSLVDET
ncbi:uncharacterized mitochondrial protein-like protein [Tanacetum coccineum]